MINIIMLDDTYKNDADDQKEVWEQKFKRNGISSNVTIHYSPYLLLENISNFSLNSILILDLDLDMDDINGIIVLHKIREMNIHIPIIIYSAKIEPDMYQSMAKDNAFTFVRKGNQGELIESIKDAFNLLEDAIPLELSEAINEYITRHPEIKDSIILTKDNRELSFGELVSEINCNTEFGISYQKALYKMSFEDLLKQEKKL